MRVRHLGLMITVAAGLAACQTPLPPPPAYPDITFANEAPIRLDVAAVEVVDEYMPPLKPPNVDHEFPVKIAAVAERWAHDRLQAVGRERTARVVIKDASAVSADLPKTTGLRGMFTTDQGQRYSARVEMTVQILDPHGLPLATASAISERSRTVPEDITLNGRDKVFFEMTDALMRDEDAALDANIRKYMQIYIQ